MYTYLFINNLFSSLKVKKEENTIIKVIRNLLYEAQTRLQGSSYLPHDAINQFHF